MASLGWLLNLGFAGSGAGAVVTGPIAGSLLLLGVGRMWWIPIVWPLLTGEAYAGEIDQMVEYISNSLFFAAGGLLTFGVFKYLEYKERKRKEALPKKFVDDIKNPYVVGSLGGPGRKCDHCGKKDDPLEIYSTGRAFCKECIKQGVR
jgi:hypothetical protein